MQTPGPRPAQSLSAVQAPHVFDDEQTGFASGQSLLATHSTHAPVVEEQTGLAGVSVMHVRVVTTVPHATHDPASEQNGVVGDDEQSMSLPHWTQAPLVPQTGVAPFRSAHDLVCALSQATQLFCGPQNGVVPPQSLSVSQATQAPLAPHTGLDRSRALHSFPSVQPPQTFLVQKDFSGALQSPSATHSTH